MKSPLTKWLLLTVLSGLLILSPNVNFQDFLSPGDHGRDLYCFRATGNGDLPYRDYWWVYGPLMPFFYALFFKIFGTAIPSVLLGKSLLDLTSGTFVFLGLSLWVSPFLAFVGALWYWVYRPDFFFTYNHAGGITLMVAVTYALLAYVKKPKDKYLCWGLPLILALTLVKINFGLTTLLIFVGGVFRADRIHRIPLSRSKKIFYAAAALLPLCSFLIYFFFLRGLPLYAVHQCLPYHRSDHPYNAPPLAALRAWWQAIAFNINVGWGNRLFAALIIVMGVRTAHSLFSRGDKPMRREMLLTIALLVLSYVLNLHEYVASGVPYRTEWAKPFSILLIFLLIGLPLKEVRKSLGTLLILTLFVLLSLRYEFQMNMIGMFSRAPSCYLNLPAGGVTTGDGAEVTQTMIATTRFLDKVLKKDERFFALPYDPLYYYLTGRRSPTRQLIFFEHIKIPPEQELKVISDLKKNNVRYVLMSSRARSEEAGLGTFGRTYCPVLAKYIFDNFDEIGRFGDWKNPAGWAWNHGTMILRKKADAADAP